MGLRTRNQAGPGRAARPPSEGWPRVGDQADHCIRLCDPFSMTPLQLLPGVLNLLETQLFPSIHLRDLQMLRNTCKALRTAVDRGSVLQLAAR